MNFRPSARLALSSAVLFALLPFRYLGGQEAKGGARDNRAPSHYQADTSRLKPLTDMLPADEYKGFKGGLYPDGTNQRPGAHEQAGLKLAGQIRPLDAQGKAANDGKIVLLGIGFSNTVQCFNGFIDAAAAAKDINPHVVLVNGAQGSRSAFMIQDPDNGHLGQQYWRTWVPSRLRAAGVTTAQVQVAWLKETDARLFPLQLQAMGIKEYDCPLDQPFPKGDQTLQGELRRIVQTIHRLFPNVKMVYLSSRSYGGYAQRGNPEPFPYESGFAVKWLIEEQIQGKADLNFDPANGEVKAPWLSWGPYLWANGFAKRADGYEALYEDYSDRDHLHHSPQGIRKMGGQLLRFLVSDTTTRGWFCVR